MRADTDRLHDILDAIARIERYSSQGREAFYDSDLIQTWMVHNIEIIGEASRALSDEFRSTHAQVPWREIIGMRHVLIHHYFDVDADAVWAAVERDIPTLRVALKAILQLPPTDVGHPDR